MLWPTHWIDRAEAPTPHSSDRRPRNLQTPRTPGNPVAPAITPEARSTRALPRCESFSILSQRLRALSIRSELCYRHCLGKPKSVFERQSLGEQSAEGVSV